MMRRMTLPLCAIIALAFVWSSCGRDKDSDSPLGPGGAGKGATGSVEFSVGFAPWHPFAAKESAVKLVDTVTAYVYDTENYDVAEENLAIADGRAKGSITVEAQNDLRVALVYYEKETVKYLGEDGDVDVPARGSATADITAHYMGTSVIAPDTAYVGREYTVSWMKRPFARYYELQEANESDFSDASTVYADPDTSYVIEAKRESEAKLTFYYRARVWTQYGAGPWHGVGATGVAGIEGTIVIDVPMPPENPGGGIGIVSPNGGEIWSPHTSHDITWTGAGVNKVKIELSTDNGVSWSQIAYGIAASAGKYTFTMPDVASSSCLVRVASTADGTVFDTSDAPFATHGTSARSLVLTVPRGGEVWSAGSTRTITWTSAGVATVTIELSRDLGMTWTAIASGVAASPGSYSWQVPDDQAACLIRIRDTADAGLASRTETPISIVRAMLSLSAPNGGESLKGKSIFNIRWTSAGVEKIKIEYSIDNGSAWTLVASDISAPSGTYLWQAPQTVSQNCLVRVTDTSNASLADRSDTVFSLVAADAGTIVLNTPNGGEKFLQGASLPIRWTAAVVDTVVVSFSKDNGATWSTVARKAGAAGNHTWTTPAITSSQCHIRVSDSANPQVSDMSDAPFSIGAQAASLTLGSFNGGTYNAGVQANIQWTAVLVDSVRVEFSPDGGATWQVVNRAVRASNGGVTWKAPDISSSNCMIRVSDTKNPQLTDRSDPSFTILPVAPLVQLAITSPNGGESFAAGSTQSIRWTSANAGTTVHIEFSSDGGTNWTRIASDRSIYGSPFSWQVPAVPSSQCLVRLIAGEDIRGRDTSDAPFSITASGAALTLMSPNGRETLTPGAATDIVWTSVGVNTVKLEYLDYQTWVPIADNVPASGGRYSWVAPALSASTKIRVSDTSNAQINDESNEYFTITATPSPTLRLTAPIGGERWPSGTTHDITWTSSGVDKIDIYYELSGTMIKIASAVDAHAGSYPWVVPSTGSGWTRIKVVSTSLAPAHTGSIFTIPSLRMNLPVGGASLVVGSDAGITWESSGVTKVGIDFSADNGVTWSPVAANIWADAKSFTWKVPVIRSSQCLLRITDMDTQNYSVRTASPFTIRNSLAVLTPDGRDRLTEGNVRTISWKAIGTERVRIEFTNDGTTWTEIAGYIDASLGAFAWTVPNIASEHCGIRVTDADYATVSARSATFTIKTTHGTISLSAPVGGENYTVGSSAVMKWTTTGVSTVRIDFSSDGGRTWIPLSTRVPANTASFTQWLPKDVISSTCFLRVVDQEDDLVSDSNDTAFSIVAGGTAQLRKL